MDIVENISATVNSSLEGIYSNKTASAVIGLFLVLYAGLAAPKLPKSVAKLFGNSAFRLVILFLVAYMSSRNTSIAIIATVALVVSMQTLSYHEANEKVHQKIEEEVMMETAEGEVDEEEVLDTEEAERLMEEEEQYVVPRSNEEFAGFNANVDDDEVPLHGVDEETGSYLRAEEQPNFGGEEEEIRGNHAEEVYASVGEENGLLMEEEHILRPEEEHHFGGEEEHQFAEEQQFGGEEELLGEEMEARPEELMAEEVYGEEEHAVNNQAEEVELRAQPENAGYQFNVTGYSGSEFATY